MVNNKFLLATSKVADSLSYKKAIVVYIEVIDYIESKELGYHLGNVIKYISRAGLKDGKVMEDLQKAQWYLNRAIEFHNKYHGSTTSWSVSTT